MHARIRGERVVVDDERYDATRERGAGRRSRRARFVRVRIDGAAEGREKVHARERRESVSSDRARGRRRRRGSFAHADGSQFRRRRRGARRGAGWSGLRRSRRAGDNRRQAQEERRRR